MRSLAIIFAVVLITCGPKEEEQPIVNPPIPDLCDTTCKKLQALGCPEGEDIPPPSWNPDGEKTTCQQFCASNFDKFDFKCWSNINKCEQILECP
jgi:hypothetical protein